VTTPAVQSIPPAPPAERTIALSLDHLAQDAEAALASLANALCAEVQAREELESVRWLLRCRESVPWTSMGADGPLLNGKNEQTRDAQFVQWCVADTDHAGLRGELANAEREHRLTLAQVEVWRERVKTTRALLAALGGQA
jgi:hypothetical protein